MTCQPKMDLNISYFDESTNETELRKTMMLDYACNYNNIIFSTGYKYYIQECLGPNVPVVFLVETATNFRIAVLDPSTTHRMRIGNLSNPQIKKIEVEIEDGYKAQVKLYLPQVLREYEDVTFPLILIVYICHVRFIFLLLNVIIL